MAPEATMWAEWYRLLAEVGLPPLRALPRDVVRFDVRAVLVADLTTDDQLREIGLTAPTPGRRIWQRFRRAGERVWRDGWKGLIAPGALATSREQRDMSSRPDAA